MAEYQFLSRALAGPYGRGGDAEKLSYWSIDNKLLPAVTAGYVPESSRNSDEGNQTTYANLPKIHLRLRSLPSDFSLLGKQFVDTLVVLQLLVHHRLFFRRPAPGLQQHDYRMVHLHTNPKTSLGKLSSTLMLHSSWLAEDIPMIFPVASGVWELLVERSYLHKLLISNCSNQPLAIYEPPSLPKGIVGRAAQIRSVARLDDRWVSEALIDTLEQFPWNHIMKDTAESMSIHQSNYAIIGSRIYEL
ncbi:MAG: hypothetical protein Q9171_001009 [Xanthocarpia ochracea]